MTVIVLSGPIGAGKSSLTSILSDYLGTKPFYESVDDNPVLPLFYADPKKYAFLLQVYFLNTRFHSINPDLLVHIDVSYDTMIKRIKKRGRPYEQLSYDSTLEDYYKRLLEYYKPWYEKYDYSPKMTIDGDELDFMASEHDRQIVLNQITAKLKEMGKLPEDWDKTTDIRIEA